MSTTWPDVIDLRESSGVPFLTLQSAHEFATRVTRDPVARRQRVALRRVKGSSGRDLLRWVVWPA